MNYTHLMSNDSSPDLSQQDIVCCIDLNGLILSINDQGEDILGSQNNEIISRSFIDIFANELPLQDIDLLKQKILTNNISNFFTTTITKSFNKVKISWTSHHLEKVNDSAIVLVGTVILGDKFQSDETAFYTNLIREVDRAIIFQDFSKVKKYLDQLPVKTLDELKDYLATHQIVYQNVVELSEIIELNNGRSRILRNLSKETYKDSLQSLITPEPHNVIKQLIYTLYTGKSYAAQELKFEFNSQPRHLFLELYEIQKKLPYEWSIVSVIDLSPMIEIRTKLALSENLHRSLIDQYPDGLIVFNQEGVISEINAQTRELLGYTKMDLLGNSIEILLLPEDLVVYPLHLDITGSTSQQTINRRIKRKDGEIRNFEIKIKHLTNGLILGTLRDVTDEQRLFINAQLNRKRLQEAQRIGKIGHWEWNIEDDSFIASKYLREMCGLHPVLELTIEDFLSILPQDQERILLTKFINTQQSLSPFVFEHDIKTVNGRRHVVTRGEMLLADVPIIHGTLQDITEIKMTNDRLLRMREQLLQAQKMEALGRMAGGISHDFNNMLTGILGYASLIKKKLEPSSAEYQDIMDLMEIVNRSSNITNQLLSFSREKHFDQHVIRPDAVIEETSKFLSRIITEEILLQIDINCPNVWIEANPAQLEQLIMNLTVNARDAMPNGGKLTIQTRVIDSPPNVTVMDRYEWYVLSIKDTGHGMSEETKKHIYEPFFSTKGHNQGTGLGLSIVYGIVQQHNGFIEFESNQGVGTEFYIYLPTIPPPVSQTKQKEGVKKTNKVKKLLLAEDDDTLRQLLNRLLTINGYEVISFEDGEAAYEYFQEMYQKNQLDIDLLITDVIMPRMRGSDLVQKVREKNSELPVIFMSGYAEDNLKDIQPDNKIKFIPKPFNIQDLIQLIANE